MNSETGLAPHLDPGPSPAEPSPRSEPLFGLLPCLLLSGVAALICEVLWMRRLALAFGSTGLATTLTLGLYMAGLGLGGAFAGRKSWRRAPLGYGLLELGSAAWILAFPFIMSLVDGIHGQWPGLGGAFLVSGLLLLPPAFLHGCTLPAASAALGSSRGISTLYAVNTLGATLGTLLGSFVVMPMAGLRGTEILAALCALGAGLGALAIAASGQGTPPRPTPHPLASEATPLSRDRAWILLAAALGGCAGMALEVVWSRLGALLLGGSVYALALVLAVYLMGIAFGAALPWRGILRRPSSALLAMGLLAVAGTLPWPYLPVVLGQAWSLGGESLVSPAGALLLALTMVGAPIASGALFTASLDAWSPGRAHNTARTAGAILAANTVGSVLGATLAGLWILPLLGLRGTLLLFALPCAALGLYLALREKYTFKERNLLSRPGLLASATALLTLLLALISPGWDAALYATGLYLRVDQFADLSPRAIDRFAHEGWRLLFYEDGRTATVAVGESLKTGNRWISVNGKVDASTGSDMPTQIFSGRLPVATLQGLGQEAPEGLIIGLASGVTAGEALAEGARAITVLEIEPEVLEAARFFDEANRGIMDDPRAKVQIADARAWMVAWDHRWDFIVSEPSNPWITGASNLFTREYWELGRARLAPNGVFCQWVQLYALPPAAFRSLIRTFTEVFPQSWLFETIEGADALLLAAPSLPEGLPLEPSLGPEQLQRLAHEARLNTDDRPWIEFEAPRWLHRSTGEMNRELLERARRP